MIYFLMGKIGEPFYSLLIKIFNMLKLVKSPEKIMKYGDLNSDVTFYVISNLSGGLASQYDAALGYIDRAIKKEYIPVIDLQDSLNDCLKDKEREEKNPWNYYFEQPVIDSFQRKYTLEEVYKSSRVIHCSSLHTVYKRVNKKSIHKRFLLSKNIKIIEPQYSFIKQIYENLFKDTVGDMVGVYYRGTDYKTVGDWKPVGHAKVPRIEMFCDALEMDLKKWNCNSVFFVTEEQEALEYFLQRFPDTKYVKKERFYNFAYGKTIAEQVPKCTSRFKNNLLYLTDIFILSKCQYLVGTVNSGLLMAMNWNNNKYKDFDILSYGITK